MVSSPVLGLGRVCRVMAVRVTSPLPPWTAKSSAEKRMASPIRAFLAKSATTGESLVLFQKKAETGRDTAKARASVREQPRMRRANCLRFKGITSLFVDVSLLFARGGGIFI